jgi:hypothetical protein
MIFLKNYNSFKESIQIDIGLIEIDINESLGMFYDKILQSIGAEEVNFFNTLNLPQEDFADKTNLDLLTTNPEFIHSLSSIGLKKSNLTNSEDFETFLNKPCKFLLIYNIESNELENPIYIIFQSWNETLSKWDGFKMFKINGDIKTFYDKLSSKVIEVDDNGKVISIEEKPINPKSNFAVPGIYFLDENASKIASELSPSSRGELEITDLLKEYLKAGKLQVTTVKRGTGWMDAGTTESLFAASELVRVLQNRQGYRFNVPEEIAFNQGWISKEDLRKIAISYSATSYGDYLSEILQGR